MSLIKVNILFLTCLYFTKVLGFHNFFLKNHQISLENRNNLTISSREIREKYITQPLDHFNKRNNHSWRMRYFEDLQFWKPGGPVYLYINGEAEASDYFIQTGIIHELARETRGALYLSEHRYYGKSKPFPNLNTKTLAYLSSRQALADIAKLLRQIQSLPKHEKSAVVVVGGSYAGSLAAWMRLLYDDLVDVAISSSAPFYQKADFFEYVETVGFVYKQFGSLKCYERIEKKFKRFERLLETATGTKKLKKEENVCDSVDLSKPENRGIFFAYEIARYTGLAQYGSPEKIRERCYNDSSLDNLSCSSKLTLTSASWNRQESCYDLTFDGYVEDIKNSDSMSWTYQTCTEFGFFQSTNSDFHPFTRNVPVEFYFYLCSVLYGADFDKKRVEEGVRKTRAMYGALHPNVSQVVFVNGDLDPWHRVGILEDLSEDAPAFLVHGTRHVQHLDSNVPEDPVMLKETRKSIKKLVKKWIGINDVCRDKQ